MNKRRKKQFLILSILLVVSFISVGYASYTRAFVVSPENVTVHSGDNPFTTNLMMESDNGTVSGFTWKVPRTTFDEKTTSVTYTATVSNYTSYKAYLKSIAFDGTIKCEAVNTSLITNTAVNTFCSKINALVSVSQDSKMVQGSVTSSAFVPYNGYDEIFAPVISGTTPGINNVKLTIVLTDTSSMNDDVIIKIPDITLNYSSLGR